MISLDRLVSKTNSQSTDMYNRVTDKWCTIITSRCGNTIKVAKNMVKLTGEPILEVTNYINSIF